MIKLFKRAALVLVAAMATGVAAQAQQMPQVPELPIDSAVIKGKLDNGLTYYIRHNETPQGQADFYIAQSVGSILEEDNQRGLAHFLEHMCFNGTTNYPGSSLRDWLESIGVKFGVNLNAYTGVDQTVYNISNVPVARQSVQDSCLLILHDWANDLTLDPEEIDKERGVIHEEWRRSMVGQMRILEKLLPTIYPDSKYGHRLPIGIMEVVDNFEPQAIRDYYETWYRPDNQAIIVVGDIDPAYIEGKIKEMFSSIEMPENPKERVYYPVADTPGTIYAIGSDPEQKMGMVDLMFKSDLMIPREMNNTQVYLMLNYITNMAETMLDQRLTDIGHKADAPFAQAGASYSDFFLAKTKKAFDVSGVAKGNDVLPVLEAIYRELLRAKRGGFTPGEYERAKAEYLSRLEKAYNTRNNTQNEAYVNEYVNNFLDNEPIPGIEMEYEMMKQLVDMIPLEAINQALAELVTDNNRVLLVLTPQNDTFKVPTEAELAAVIAKVDAEEIEPYKDEMKSEPLIPSLPAPGKVVSIEDNAQWGAKLLTLSNGVKVFVKPTDFKKDEIVMDAVAIGGDSEISDSQAANIIFMPYAMSMHGLGTYNSTDIQRYLQGKQASVGLGIHDLYRTVSGTTTVKDLPTMMELLYMTFKDYTIDEESFEAAKARYSGIIANQEAAPEFIFQKELMANIYKSAASQLVSTDIIAAANREDILEIIHGALANAADYTFAFVGDIDLDTFIPLAEQYIATLPADAQKASKKAVVNPGREITPGSETKILTTKMETPQTWTAVILSGKVPYTPANRWTSTIASQILGDRLLNKIREEMGATYSIGAYSEMDRLGDMNTLIQIPFPMKPEMKDQVLAEIHDIINNMADNVTADEVRTKKEYLVKSANEQYEENDSWAGSITATTLNGVDIFNGKVDAINAVTADDVKAFMKNLLDQNNYRVFILDPAE